MSWHYSQALVEVCSQDDSKDGTSSVLLKSNPTVEIFCSEGKTKDTSTHSPFGMTLEHSTGDPLVDQWILSQQASRVSRFLQQDTNFITTIHAISGLTPYVSFGKWNPNSSSWKMSLSYLLQDTLHKWPKTWPRAGIVSDGECYPLVKWMRHIREIESGLLPTPAAGDYKRSTGKSQFSRNTPGLSAQLGGVPHPEFTEWMMGWPIGWTALEPLATDKFQRWLRLHQN